MEVFLVIFQLIVLLYSVVIHEVAHGAVAERLGDPTARFLGRITLNPIRHLDPVGSVLVPLLLVLLPGGVVFGWAKPVPYDPRNLRHPERDGALIALAGPLSNLCIALAFGVFARMLAVSGSSTLLLALVSAIILLNVSLAVFNLVPIPPLDGSKILSALLPRGSFAFHTALERYGIFILLLFIWFGFSFLTPVIHGLFRLIAGGEVASLLF
jgi:Zn-dependent protease